MKLSYSAYHLYEECPLKFYHSYIAYTKPTKPQNNVGSLFGSVIGGVFELFYTEKIWASINVLEELALRIKPVMKQVMQDQTKYGGIYDWTVPRQAYHSPQEVADDVYGHLRNGLDIIRTYDFLGPYMGAEVVLDTPIEKHYIRGRADFIIQRVSPHNDMLIIDGKGSRHRGKYISGTQLRWYAWLYNKRYNTYPDKLAFLFWRQPPKTAIDWVPFDRYVLQRLETTVIKTCDKITEDRKSLGESSPQYGSGPFQPTPSQVACKFCPYQDLCEESPLRKSQQEEERLGVLLDDDEAIL